MMRYAGTLKGTAATSANKTTFDSGLFLTASTTGSGTLTNGNSSDYGSGINFTLSNVTISGTG